MSAASAQAWHEQADRYGAMAGASVNDARVIAARSPSVEASVAASVGASIVHALLAIDARIAALVERTDSSAHRNHLP